MKAKKKKYVFKCPYNCRYKTYDALLLGNHLITKHRTPSFSGHNYDVGDTCLCCGGKLRPEHAHSRCEKCNARDSCCW